MLIDFKDFKIDIPFNVDLVLVTYKAFLFIVLKMFKVLVRLIRCLKKFLSVFMVSDFKYCWFRVTFITLFPFYINY